MLCSALLGEGPSGRSELPAPGSVQKDTENGWADQELRLNPLGETVDNLEAGPTPDL